MNGDIRQGWKEIASYLDVTPRHAQRLEKEKGLPVHRSGSLAAPFAYIEELDRWRTDPGLVPKPGGDAPAKDTQVFSTRAPSRRGLIWALSGLFGLAILLALSFEAFSWFRPKGLSISGQWTRRMGSWEGQAPGAGRLDTGSIVGPGSSVFLDVTPLGGRWSGGIEIYQDDTHWTFVDLSPDQKELILWRYPAGPKTIFEAPSLERGRAARVHLSISQAALDIDVDGRRAGALALDPWDVRVGRLVLRVGRHRDEWGPEAPGHATFERVSVGKPFSGAPWLALPLPDGQASLGHSYEARLFNVDDQLDLLLDGKRVATVGYIQTSQPIELAPYLSAGRHRLTLQVFNRQMTATYGVFFQADGRTVWEAQCGTVGKDKAACTELGTTLGMVKELAYEFDVPSK